MTRAEWTVALTGAAVLAVVGVVLFELSGYPHSWLAVVVPFVSYPATWWLLNKAMAWRRSQRVRDL